MNKIIKIFIPAIIIFLTVGIGNTEKSECPKGYISTNSTNKIMKACYNPDKGLAYFLGKDYKIFSLNHVACGTNCDLDGNNCEIGICNEKEIKKHGYTEIKNRKFYNPQTHLSYSGFKIYDFYIDDVWCGYGCKLDATSCKTGVCNIKKINKLGYTKIKNGRFYNPKTHISYEADKFYIDDLICGYNCNTDGTNCKSGICSVKDCKKGFSKIKDGKCYNPKTHLSYEYKYFYIDNIWCGLNCNKDGTNCEIGICDKNEIKKHGYTEIKNGRFYNPKTNISFKGYGFYIDDEWCGKSCDLDGNNCAIGICNLEYCKRNGFPKIKEGKCYNPKTDLSYTDYNFYIDGKWCGFGCNSNGTDCKLGNCYKNK